MGTLCAFPSIFYKPKTALKYNNNELKKRKSNQSLHTQPLGQWSNVERRGLCGEQGVLSFGPRTQLRTRCSGSQTCLHTVESL